MSYKTYTLCTEEEKSRVDSDDWMEVGKALEDGIAVDRVIERLARGDLDPHPSYWTVIAEKADDLETQVAALHAGHWMLADRMLKAHGENRSLLMHLADPESEWHISFADRVADSGDVGVMREILKSGEVAPVAREYRMVYDALSSADPDAVAGIEPPAVDPDREQKRKFNAAAYDIVAVGAWEAFNALSDVKPRTPALHELVMAVKDLDDIARGRKLEAVAWLDDETDTQYGNLLRNIPLKAAAVEEAARAVREEAAPGSDEELDEALGYVERALEGAEELMASVR